MITLAELEKLSVDRLEDAKALEKAGRYDGAYYICGYALEMALKKRICVTLGWLGYPNTRKEFEDLGSFKTHNLEILLHLSGVESKIKSHFFGDWSAVTAWEPEIRYSARTQTTNQVSSMMAATEVILKNL